MARFTCDLDALKKSIASFGQGELEGSRGGAIGHLLLALPSPKPFTCPQNWECSGQGVLFPLGSGERSQPSPCCCCRRFSLGKGGLCALSLRCRALAPVCHAVATVHTTKKKPEKRPLSFRAFGCSREPPAVLELAGSGGRMANGVGPVCRMHIFGVFLFQFPIQRTATPPARAAAPSPPCP